MQLTIDSNQPLKDVLRVVGAMYDVELTAGKATAHAPSGRTRAGSARRGPNTARSRGRRRSSGARASTAEIRTWAIANGHDVAARGRIPAIVVEAFRSAQR